MYAFRVLPWVVLAQTPGEMYTRIEAIPVPAAHCGLLAVAR
jgi:hypothetical protein